MHNNTYTVVGTSVLNNVCKIRFANGLDKRKRILGNPKNPKGMHVDIKLIECEPMHKLDAAKFLLAQILAGKVEHKYNEVEIAPIEKFIKSNTPAE